MKTSLSRWGWSLFSALAFLIAVYITLWHSLPYYVLSVEILGFWEAVWDIFWHWATIVAPFLVIGIGVRAYKSIRYAVRKNSEEEL